MMSTRRSLATVLVVTVANVLTEANVVTAVIAGTTATAPTAAAVAAAASAAAAAIPTMMMRIWPAGAVHLPLLHQLLLQALPLAPEGTREDSHLQRATLPRSEFEFYLQTDIQSQSIYAMSE